MASASCRRQKLERERLFQWRVPLTAPACPANVNGEPLAESIDPSLATNVCSVTQPSGSSAEVIHFENPIFNVALQIPLGGNGKALVPPDGTAISMPVTGGGQKLSALLGVDTQAQQPRYAVVAPDGQTVYVIDEGLSGGGVGLARAAVAAVLVEPGGRHPVPRAVAPAEKLRVRRIDDPM